MREPRIETIQDIYESYIKADKVRILQVREGSMLQYSGRSFERDICSTMHFLRSKGIAKGSHIAVCLYNSYELIVLDAACFLLSAVVVPIHTTLSPYQIEEILRHSDSAMIVVNREYTGNIDCCLKVTIEEIQEQWKGGGNGHIQKIECAPDDLALLMYTSGTSGKPKGVMLTHRNIVSNVIGSSKALPLMPGDTVMSFLPFSHSFERIVDYVSIFRGAKLAYPESVLSVQKDIQTIRPTIVAAVPRFYEKIYEGIIGKISNAPNFVRRCFQRLERGEPPGIIGSAVINALIAGRVKKQLGGRIRYFISGGAALAGSIQVMFRKLGITILQGYGLTEASPVVSVNRPEKIKPGSVGTPLDNIKVRLEDDGELLVRGPNVMQGYYKDEAETARSIRDGWLYTGDIARIDEEGFITIVERKKQLLKTSTGKYIAPTPLEMELKKVAGVTEVVVIGDNRKFVSAVIFVERATNELDKHIKSKLEEINSRVAGSEQIKIFKVIEGSPPSELYTPTLKLKRQKFNECYNELIEAIYSNENSNS